MMQDRTGLHERGNYRYLDIQHDHHRCRTYDANDPFWQQACTVVGVTKLASAPQRAVFGKLKFVDWFEIGCCWLPLFHDASCPTKAIITVYASSTLGVHLK